MAHPVHPLQRQHHHAGRGGRASLGRGAAAQAGVAALRHHGQLVGVAGVDQCGHFLGAAGAQHGQGIAGVALAPVGQVGGLVGGLGQHVLRAHCGAAEVEERIQVRSGHGRVSGEGGWMACCRARARRLYGRR
ncbi:hypothetical protein D3C86_1837810 [compost metagenome]